MQRATQKYPAGDFLKRVGDVGRGCDFYDPLPYPFISSYVVTFVYLNEFLQFCLKILLFSHS